MASSFKQCPEKYHGVQCELIIDHVSGHSWPLTAVVAYSRSAELNKAASELHKRADATRDPQVRSVLATLAQDLGLTADNWQRVGANLEKKGG